ncbi:MAG TPA: GNAT family N-acetyltransferase [Bradyrhizobium sp.]|uniref:GNAT family N-acetyltransferase n=1 Tax=Bradyrhizobium sp. TaxID=376 RepID=UPI002D80FEA4|nr:GNAT family N-acetyltransferase [Bradyrhizobium sp.]HET7884958.1 GNAT family N-acetyltransferase [Bradyrhizobium sp.]
MATISLFEHPRHTDHLRLRDGRTLTVRFVGADEGEALQRYFRNLSLSSRHSRFLGAMSELPPRELGHFLRVGENNRFSVIATVATNGRETIVGEARYGLDTASRRFEFGISVDDLWQRLGIGSALIANLECRAAALGARVMFGETLRSNEKMISLARKLGYGFARHPDDWKLVRFEKEIDAVAEEFPCASWKLVAQQRAIEAVA